jgi:hypothetical protein
LIRFRVGKQSPQPQQAQQLAQSKNDGLDNIPNEHIPIDSLISDLPYDDGSASNLNSIDANLNASVNGINSVINNSLNTSLTSSLNNSLSHALNSGLSPSLTPSMSPSIAPSNHLALISTGVGTHSHNPNNSPTPTNTAHAVALLANAESQKIQRKKANQQEREVLEKYVPMLTVGFPPNTRSFTH